MASICVAGLWHQGTVLAACLADLGHRVSGVDEDADAIAGLESGRPPVHEPKLGGILRRNLRAGRLRLTTDFAEALREAEFVYIAVDTPFGPEGEPDLSGIFALARRIGATLSTEPIVVVSAQVPVGTCERFAEVLREASGRAGIQVVYVPEFLRLGSAVDTFRRADRFVIGAAHARLAEQVAELYRPLGRPIVLTDVRTAEMAKHACNAYLALSISAINEIADLCERVGADVVQVAEIMKLDGRIGPRAYLSPGLGFAGGTLGRDIRALQQLGREQRTPSAVFDAVMEVNQARAGLVGRRLAEVYPSLDGLSVGVLGLTYKPGTSTLRGSIALEIIRDLVRRGAVVRAFDPLARLDEVGDLPPLTMWPDPYTALKGCDAAVVITPWDGMRDLDVHRVRMLMRRPVWVDTRNVFDPARMREAGFTYMGVGRGGAAPPERGEMERRQE